MIKLKKNNKRTQEEEAKKAEEEKNGTAKPVTTSTKSPGELRLQKEI